MAKPSDIVNNKRYQDHLKALTATRGPLDDYMPGAVREGQIVKVKYPNAAMTADMQFILDGLQDGIAAAQRHVQFTQQRYNAYIVQCAEALGVNNQRFMFNADTRTFTDNPNYKEPEPHQ